MANKFAEKMKKRTEDNPAMMFIGTPAEEPEALPEVSTAPEKSARKTAAPEPDQRADVPMVHGREAKSRRLQLLIQPSLYNAVKARADAEGVSVNEEIGELLKRALMK